jgi:pimeloyl-ACP methyl ester carboxylesterase
MLRQRSVAVNGVELVVTEAGEGPPVILSHGFPETAYSWRHQLPALAAAGYHAIAPDQRGYGHSSAPRDVGAYGIEQLTDDLLGLLDETGHEQAVFVGHDWGALIVWDLVRLHPERVRAAVAASVPLTLWGQPPTQLLRMVFGDRFNYILYFQPVGPAEAELEADPRRTMARVLWSVCGDAPDQSGSLPPMEGSGFLTHLADPPEPLPAWLTHADIDAYAAAFAHSGFFGPISYYRNLDANYELVKDLPVNRISMPVLFIAGERDPVIRPYPPLHDFLAGLVTDLRGTTLLTGTGHWVQQEQPDTFNDALLAFLASL